MIRDYLKKFDYGMQHSPFVGIKPSKLGYDSGKIGAACLVLFKQYEDLLFYSITQIISVFFQAMERLGTSPGALPSGGSGFPVAMSFP